MKRFNPTKRQKKIFKRNQKIKRSTLRQEAKFRNKQDDIIRRERLALINRWNQEESRKRLMCDMGMDPYHSDGFAEALAILGVANARREQRRREEITAMEVVNALSDGKTVTVSSNGDFTITEPINIPKDTIVIVSPRVRF